MAKTSVSDWDTSAGNNTDINSIDITGATGKVKDGDNALREIMAEIASYTRRGANLASASGLNLDSIDSLIVYVTGTTTVTSITLTDKHFRLVRAVGLLPITASAALVLDGATTGTFTLNAEDWLLVEGDSGVVYATIISGGVFAQTAPTVTAATGAFTSVAATVQAVKQGKKVWWTATVTITTKNTAAGEMLVPLPFTPVVNASASGIVSTTTVACAVRIISGAATARVSKYDGTTMIADGVSVFLEGTYFV